MYRLLIIIPLLFSFCKEEGSSGGGGGGGGGSTISVIDLLPQDNEISGWARDGNYELATNYQELYDIIDGEAQVYIDHGFVEGVFQDYKGLIGQEEVKLEVRIFDMGASSNAKDVYDAVASGGETPWDEPGHAGEEARIDEGLLFAYAIDFYKNKFFSRVTIQKKSDEALGICKTFCINISDAIE